MWKKAILVFAVAFVVDLTLDPFSEGPEKEDDDGREHFTGYGAITVMNKLTKAHVLTVKEGFMHLVNRHRSAKVRLLKSAPPTSDACSKLKDIPEDANGYSVGGISGAQRLSLLLVEDGGCPMEQKIENVKSAGYSGLLMAVNGSRLKELKVDLEGGTLDASVSVALVGIEDIPNGDFTKYAASRYSFEFRVDKTFTEIILGKRKEAIATVQRSVNVLKVTVLRWVKRLKLVKTVENVLIFLIQLLLLASPILFLLVMTKRGPVDYPDWNNDDNFTKNFTFTFTSDQRQENTSWEYFWEETNNNDNDNESKRLETLVQHRRLLGVSDQATKRDVEVAFRQKAMKYHPDKNMDLPEKEKSSLAETFKTMLNAKTALVEDLEKRPT